jgi:hypothetical protein
MEGVTSSHRRLFVLLLHVDVVFLVENNFAQKQWDYPHQDTRNVEHCLGLMLHRLMALKQNMGCIRHRNSESQFRRAKRAAIQWL